MQSCVGWLASSIGDSQRFNPISTENSIKFGIDQCILCSVRFNRWSRCVRLSFRPFFLLLHNVSISVEKSTFVVPKCFMLWLFRCIMVLSVVLICTWTIAIVFSRPPAFVLRTTDLLNIEKSNLEKMPKKQRHFN